MAIVICLLSARVARADDDDLDPEQIKVALHTITDIEEGFVDRTIKLVQAGTLPRDMFQSTFLWARKKPRHKFQYFKQALTVRAAGIGVTL
jgi:hypothetical protein